MDGSRALKTVGIVVLVGFLGLCAVAVLGAAAYGIWTAVGPQAAPDPTFTPGPVPTRPPSEAATPTPSPRPSATPESPDVAFVSDVTVPDDTELPPGVDFVKTWRIRSSGGVPWPAGSRWAFVSGDQMGAPESVDLPATALGSTADVSVPMKAPETPGTYRGVWQAVDPGGNPFGARMFVLIVVPEPATITFVADRYAVKSGMCATLSWLVRRVKAVYYGDEPAGGNGSRVECPTSTTTYLLRVQMRDDSWVTREITINVEPAY